MAAGIDVGDAAVMSLEVETVRRDDAVQGLQGRGRRSGGWAEGVAADALSFEFGKARPSTVGAWRRART